MTDALTDDELLEARAELALLTASARAYLEWQLETGADGLPAEEPREAEHEPEALVAHEGLEAHEEPEAHEAHEAHETRAPEPPAPMAPIANVVQLVRPSLPAPAQYTQVARAAPLDGDARVARLEVLRDEVRSCTRCALHTGRKQTVFARGNPQAELVFVGEGPGANEDIQGLPFVGEAGQLLDKMIGAMKLRPDGVYICNIVKCRPPNNRKPEPDELASCLPYLTEQLGCVAPRVIVALGATAVQGLFGTTEGITRLRGKWKLYKGTIPVMPTFHPAYLLRQPNAKREVWEDLQQVMKMLAQPPS